MQKVKCNKCFNDIRPCNLSKHQKGCSGIYIPFKKLVNCKYCNLDLNIFSTANRANHVRWCDENPLRDDYIKKATGAQLQTKESVQKRTEGIKKAHAAGKYHDSHERSKGRPGKKHSDESKEKISQKARASDHRRLVRSIREYKCKDGSIVQLDSSWEESLARRLDILDIEWTRPPPLRWIDKDGLSRNYFPDFYLPKHNIFLDPKNPQAVRVQQEKINQLKAQYNNIIFIESLDGCINFTI